MSNSSDIKKTGSLKFKTLGTYLKNEKITLLIVPASSQKIKSLQFGLHYILLAIILFGSLTFSLIYFLPQLSKKVEEFDLTMNQINENTDHIDSLSKGIAGLRDSFESFEAALHRNASGIYKRIFSKNGYMDDQISYSLTDNSERTGKKEPYSMVKNLKNTVEDTTMALEDLSASQIVLKEILEDLPTEWPLMNGIGYVTARFGYASNPFNNLPYIHKGLDFGYGYGAPIVSVANGVVVEQKYDPYDYGNYVVIRHPYGYSSKYAHLQKAYVKVGDKINQGQVIGTMGSTGKVTGPHLHLETYLGTQVINPETFISMKRDVEQSLKL